MDLNDDVDDPDTDDDDDTDDATTGTSIGGHCNWTLQLTTTAGNYSGQLPLATIVGNRKLQPETATRSHSQKPPQDPQLVLDLDFDLDLDLDLDLELQGGEDSDGSVSGFATSG